ncbi:serine/threonine-protein kinase [Actinoallomurus rhizosphaericola]|uniref:serine/threonine-protein kinase n=1 Tax=Actinoallomurus rhizosphaericola TaxID=2952536 RepID=UPI0027E2F914|nr:serine/threonine-protein kinase [Actinoallomurus rhizosphaericola]
MNLGDLVAGRYRITKGPLDGGTNELWEAVDEGLDLRRKVVLKRLADDGAAALARLKAEARAQAAFSHPHVVTLYNVERDETETGVTWWLVLEHVPHGSLDGRGKKPARWAAGIGAQIADALAALHAKGIVHCDVKPGNILIADETAKLTDFGAAYRMEHRETNTPNGELVHTPAYAAPEVVKGRPEPASDVFSLAVTILALILGRPVRTVPAPSESDDPFKDVEPLRDVLAAMLRPDPADRPDAAEAHRRLAELAESVEAPAPIDVVPVPPPKKFTSVPVPRPGQPGGSVGDPGPPPGPIRRRSRLIVVSAVVVALAAAGGWYPLRHLTREPPGKHPHARPKPSERPGIKDADPCALIAPGPLRKFGETEVDDAAGNFNRCDVIVHSGQGGVVDVEVQFVAGPGPEQASSVRTMGPVRVVAGRASGGECDRTLLLPAPDDGFTAIVSADSNKPAPLCKIADTATTSAVGVIRKGPIRRRSLPARSLGRQNACALLGGKALDIVPGIDASDPVSESPWDCKWRSTTEDIQVKLRFDRGQPLTGADGRVTWLNGYRTVITPQGDGNDTCLVRVVYRDYNGSDEQKMIEMLYLTIEGKPSTTRLCSIGTGLAGSAAAALPHV